MVSNKMKDMSKIRAFYIQQVTKHIAYKNSAQQAHFVDLDLYFKYLVFLD